MMQTHKPFVLLFTVVVLSITMWSCKAPKSQNNWNLVWEENFNEAELDTTIWSKIPRGGGWAMHMSDLEELYQLKDGCIYLGAIKNTTLPNDTAKYLTGGIWSRYKKEFSFGKIEVRAKFSSAKGFWPAIWMIADPIPYPYGGEIDIMEHLNHDDFVYQTSHSHYTIDLKKDTPKKYTTAKINRDGFNTYAVEMYKDSLVYSVNGEKTITYPKINGGKDGQFPFAYDPFHLRLDAQLSGSWVGPVDPKELPAALIIDWVKFYKK